MKVLFIHNRCMWYRLPLFQGLRKLYDIKFYFTDEIKENITELESCSDILKGYGIYPFKINLGLFGVMLREDYDIVIFPPMDTPGDIFNNILCFILIKLKNKPYIIFSERWKCEYVIKKGYRKIYDVFDKYIFKKLCKGAGALLACGGNKQKEYFSFMGSDLDKVFVIPYLSDVPLKCYDKNLLNLNSSKKLDELGIKDQKVIICVSRLIKRRGIHYLLKAFSKLKEDMNDVKLLIIGGSCHYGFDKYYGNELFKLCEELNLENDVFFLGFVDSDDLPIYYNLCNVLVYPTTAENYADTGCLPCSDAMYFDKPIICTDTVGFAFDLIKNGVNGYIVPQKNANVLYDAMKKIIENPKLNKEMGLESKKLIEMKFNYEKMFDNITKVINYAKKNYQ